MLKIIVINNKINPTKPIFSPESLCFFIRKMSIPTNNTSSRNSALDRNNKYKENSVFTIYDVCKVYIIFCLNFLYMTNNNSTVKEVMMEIIVIFLPNSK